VFKPPAKDGKAAQIKTLGDYVTRVQQYEEEFVSPKKKLSFNEWYRPKLPPGDFNESDYYRALLIWNASRENM